MQNLRGSIRHDTISRSNDLLAKYQKEIEHLQEATKNNRNRLHDTSQNKSIDELADWLAGPVKDFNPKESEEILPTTFDEWTDKHEWRTACRMRMDRFGDFKTNSGISTPKGKKRIWIWYWNLPREAYKPHVKIVMLRKFGI